MFVLLKQYWLSIITNTVMLKLSAYQLKLSIIRLLKSFAQQAMAFELIMIHGSGAGFFLCSFFRIWSIFKMSFGGFLVRYHTLAMSQSELPASPYDQHKSDVTANHKSGHDVKQLFTSFLYFTHSE